MARAAALRPLLGRACSRRSNVTPDELICAAERRDAVLWLVLDGNVPVGVCATRLTRLPQGLAVENTVTGGLGLSWAPLLRARLHEYRKAENAALLVAYGRRGWGRVLGTPPTGRTPDGTWIFEDWG